MDVFSKNPPIFPKKNFGPWKFDGLDRSQAIGRTGDGNRKDRSALPDLSRTGRHELPIYSRQLELKKMVTIVRVDSRPRPIIIGSIATRRDPERKRPQNRSPRRERRFFRWLVRSSLPPDLCPRLVPPRNLSWPRLIDHCPSFAASSATSSKRIRALPPCRRRWNQPSTKTSSPYRFNSTGRLKISRVMSMSCTASVAT